MKLNLYILLFFIAGCTGQRGIETITTTRVNWVNRDTIITIAPRNAEARALIKNQDGKIILGKVEQTRKQNGITPEIKIVDNYIYAECKVDSLKVYLAWKEKHESTQITKTVTIKEKQRFIEKHPYLSLFMFGLICLIIMIGYNKLSGFFKMFI